jgi:hypothetical protein
VRDLGKHNTSVQEYSSIIVEKGTTIIMDCKGIERLRIIKERGKINH